MLARDLSRRRLALALVVALPVAFYLVNRFTDRSPHLTAGGIGASWAIGAAALFAALSARAVDERLVLDGYRPAELFAGRLVALLAASGVLSAALTGLMLVVSHPPDHVDLWLAMLLVAATSVPLGLAIGALVPHELEAVLLLLGLTGIQISLPSSSAVVGVLPLGSAQRLLDRASYGAFARGPNVARGVGWAVVLGAIAIVACTQRLRIRRTPSKRKRSVSLAVAGTALAGTVLIALPWPSAARPLRDPMGVGPRAVQAVIQQWGACLEVVAVPLNTASGTATQQGGQPGLLITLPRGATTAKGVTFFVSESPRMTATPANANARTLIARAKAIRPNCADQSP